MNKAFLFMVMLVSTSFVGCIEDPSEDLTQESEEETQDPVGVEDESGLPGVEFLGINSLYNTEMLLLAEMYDSDGFIKSYSIEGMNMSEDEYGAMDHDESSRDLCYNDGGMPIGENATFSAKYDCYPIINTILIEMCDDLNYVNQTIIINVEDNDGNTASAEYILKDEDFTACEDYHDPYQQFGPIATFFVTQDSTNVYYVEVIKVSAQENLEDFSFFLKDESGLTYIGGGPNYGNGFGEIAMQIIDGEEQGIDTAYRGNNDTLVNRANDVANDDGSVYPVHFSDNDRDGKLSAGDQFSVFGPDAGPAQDGWKLDIQFDATGDIIGSAKLL